LYAANQAISTKFLPESTLVGIEGASGYVAAIICVAGD